MTPTSCRARACSRHPSGSTSAPSRRSSREGRLGDRHRDAPRSRRARPHGAIVRRDPRRPRPIRAVATAVGRNATERRTARGRQPAACRTVDRPERAAGHRTRRGRVGAAGGDPSRHGGRRGGPDPVERLLGLIRELAPRSAAPDRDRTGSLVADRGDRPGGGRGAAGRRGRVGRLQPAVHRRAALGGRLLRPHRDPLHRPRPARRDARPRLPRSYRSLASTPDHLVTSDDLLRRSQEHTDLLATIADAGHRLGLRVWIAEREQGRRHGRGHLGDVLDEREKGAYLGTIGRAVDALSKVDAIWYIRGKLALMFEVEWTAMLGEPLLRRHARIGNDERFIRFLSSLPSGPT